MLYIQSDLPPLGFHPYKLYYFEDYEGEYLSWAWKLPSAEKLAPIPASALFVK